MQDKQDANLVGFYKRREAQFGVTPATGEWQTREPNSFDDFGGDYTMVARRPFSPSRQRKKGTTVDLDASGGYSEDLTQNNMQRELEEFFFAAMRSTPTATPTAVTSTGYSVAGAASAGFKADLLILATGFAIAGNNGLKLVSAADADSVDVTGLTAEASPPAGARIKVVGIQFDAGDLDMTAAVGNSFLLTTTATPLDELGLIPGQWVFIGGDATVTRFDVSGFARIGLNGISENAVAFDKSTFTPATLDGAGKTIRMFYGDVLKNEEDPDLIQRFSSTFERTLGRDDDGVQSENITGMVANELTWNSPLANNVTVDLAYIGQRHNTRTGAEGPLSARVDNTRARALGEEAFNTSSNIYRLRLAPIDPATLNPLPLFARVTEWSLTINNNVTSAKAQGVLGGFDVTVGNFDLDGEFTAYFSTVEAIHAVKCNRDMTFDAIYARDNGGIFLDIPLISLGGGRLEIEQDAAIMLPLEAMAAESPFGHTAMVGWFSYLPNLAMPDVDC